MKQSNDSKGYNSYILFWFEDTFLFQLLRFTRHIIVTGFLKVEANLLISSEPGHKETIYIHLAFILVYWGAG